VFVSNECRIKCKNLGLQKEGLETLLASVTSSCQFSENVLEHGNEAEVMLVKKQLTQRLNDLQNTHMAFEPQEDDVIEYEFFADEFRKAIKVNARLFVKLCFVLQVKISTVFQMKTSCVNFIRL
jgi:tripartite motif-containing protein 2/3